MAAAYCLKDGRLQPAGNEELTEYTPEVIYHLDAQGMLREAEQIPDLKPGEGLLLYAGEFYIEPLEVQIDFIKADSARSWLEALVLRHVERLRGISETLFVWAAIEEEAPRATDPLE